MNTKTSDWFPEHRMRFVAPALQQASSLGQHHEQLQGCQLLASWATPLGQTDNPYPSWFAENEPLILMDPFR